MGRDDRMKASDMFNATTYVFSKKAQFEQAFPQIEDVVVLVQESGDGITEWNHSQRYTKPSIGEYIDCHNPVCYGGGASVGALIRDMVRNKESHKEATSVCRGYEGSPKGKRRYGKCFNDFTIMIDLTYKPDAPREEAASPPKD